MTKAVPNSAETPETTDQSIASNALTLSEVDYPRDRRSFVDVVVGTVSDLYQSVVNPASKPELVNPDVFDKVNRLVSGPGKMDITKLQDGFNAILAERGVPPLKMYSFNQTDSDVENNACNDNCAGDVPEGGTRGTYILGQGLVGINERVLHSLNTVGLGKTALHEANHYMQDILVTRAIMDDVSKTKPGNFLEAVSQAYKERIGTEPNVRFLQDVEKYRGGVELTPEQRSRADWLIRGKTELKDDVKRPNIDQDLNRMNQILKKLIDSATSANPSLVPIAMVKDLFHLVDPAQDNDGNVLDLRRILFADQKITKNDLVRMFGVGPTSPDFDVNRARTVLTRLMQERQSSLIVSKGLQQDRYANYTHEDESYAVGSAFHSYIKRR
ncbi:MAG: hypothetical protein IPG59_19290 [Candidatus Melainabacteria bacterium]|nr:MAG: hypothetical protein IPG59_19290 [Candidatus Melainabacteria bacterium]